MLPALLSWQSYETLITPALSRVRYIPNEYNFQAQEQNTRPENLAMERKLPSNLASSCIVLVSAYRPLASCTACRTTP